MDVQDLPPLNSLSVELATVLDEISGVGYQRANGWRKKNPVLSGRCSRESSPESTSSFYASEEVPGVTIDPVSFDRISGFSIFSPTLLPDRKDMDTDEVGSLGYSFGSDESLFSTDMEYIDKVGGFDHAFLSEAVESSAFPKNYFSTFADFYRILDDSQGQGRVALNQVSQFFDHVAPMLSNKDVSVLQSILEKLNVKSEEQIIHLKHPDSLADERDDDVDSEIVWITSEAPSETDEFKAVETSSFVSDTFSVSEYVKKESSDDFNEDEIIWITASEELAGDELDVSSSKTVTAVTAVTKAVQSAGSYEKTPRVPLETPRSPSVQEEESEFIWITSPEEVSCPVYGTSAVAETKVGAVCEEFSGSVVVPHLIKEHTTVKSMKTSEKDQSSSSSKKQDAASPPAKTCRLFDFGGEEVIITPLTKDTVKKDENHESVWNLSYIPWHPPFVNDQYWKMPVDENMFEVRKKLMQSCFAHDSEVNISDQDKKGKPKIGHYQKLDLKNSLKEVVQYLDRSSDFHEEYQKSPVTYERSSDTEMLLVPYNNFLKNLSFCSDMSKSIPSDSSTDDTYVELRHKTSGKFEILNSENSSEIHVFHGKTDEIDVNNSGLASDEFSVEESQYSPDQHSIQKISARNSILSGEEDDKKEATASHTELLLKENLPDCKPEKVEKYSVSQQNGDIYTFSNEDCNSVVRTEMSHKVVPKKFSENLQCPKKLHDEQTVNSGDSEISSRLQESEVTIKDPSFHSENVSALQLSVPKDFTKSGDSASMTFVQNWHFSGRTPDVNLPVTVANCKKPGTIKTDSPNQQIVVLPSSSTYLSDPDVYSSVSKAKETLIINQPKSPKALVDVDLVSSANPSSCNLYDFGEEVVITPPSKKISRIGESDYASQPAGSLHNQQYHHTVSNHVSKNLASEELHDKFDQMSSEEVFPTSSLLYSSYGSDGVEDDEHTQKKTPNTQEEEEEKNRDCRKDKSNMC